MQGDLLSKLQDIQTPDAIGNWPLAWGWWVIIIMSFSLLAILVMTTYQFLKRRKAKKQALQILKMVNPAQNPMQAVQTINNVLKRVMLVYCDRDMVAKLSGEKWATWLNSVGNKKSTIDPELTQLAYQAHCSSEQASEYLKQTTSWIKASLPLSHSAFQQAQVGESHV